MSTGEPYVEIGHSKKTHGVDGEVKVFIEPEYLDAFLEAAVVFFDVQGGYVPFFVERIREASALLLKLEDVNSPEAAAAVTGKSLYMRSADLQFVSTGAAAVDYTFLEGFRIVDRESGPVGPIREILEYPQQVLAVVDYRGKEVLVPLHDQLITRVDKEAQVLEMDLPEGLLAL